MTRKIPFQAVLLVKDHEGYRADAYLCPAGVWTAGWGHTLAVAKGVSCTPRSAELWLQEDLTLAAKRLERRIGSAVVAELTDSQWAALLDFVFNLGDGPSGAKEWTLWKVLRAKDFDAVPAQLTRFCYAGGKKLSGLVKRRAAEVAAWNTGEPGLSDDEPHSAELRLADTPPAPVAKPSSSPLVTGAVGCVTACGVAAKTVSDAIQPFAEQSPLGRERGGDPGDAGSGDRGGYAGADVGRSPEGLDLMGSVELHAFIAGVCAGCLITLGVVGLFVSLVWLAVTGSVRKALR
jgi:lysozyme